MKNGFGSILFQGNITPKVAEDGENHDQSFHEENSDETSSEACFSEESFSVSVNIIK